MEAKLGGASRDAYGFSPDAEADISGLTSINSKKMTESVGGAILNAGL